MNNPISAPNKLDVLNMIVENKQEAFLRVATSYKDVGVPENIFDGFLILKFSHTYQPDDLIVTDWGVCQTLTFGGVSHYCEIPWGAVIGITNLVDIYYVWLDDVPNDSIVTFLKKNDQFILINAVKAPELDKVLTKKSEKKRLNFLRLVPGKNSEVIE